MLRSRSSFFDEDNGPSFQVARNGESHPPMLTAKFLELAANLSQLAANRIKALTTWSVKLAYGWLMFFIAMGRFALSNHHRQAIGQKLQCLDDQKRTADSVLDTRLGTRTRNSALVDYVRALR
jgi:hypothetical protein